MKVRRNEKGMSVAAGILKGALCGLGIVLLGALVITLLLNRKLLEINSLEYGVFIVTIVSVIVGCTIGTIAVGNHILIVSLGIGAAIQIALLGTTALFFGGTYQGVAVTTLLIAGVCLAVSLIMTKHAKGFQKTKNKKMVKLYKK